MSGILDLLSGSLGKELISNIAEKTGIDPQQAASVLGNSLPQLLGAMQNNASSGDGLLNALTSGKHDGSILDNLGGFLKSGDFSDGGKILGHVLGNNQSQVTNNLSSQTGVDSSIIAKILPMLAPIIMGYLGKQTQSNNVSSGADLGGLLGGLLGGSGNGGAASMGGSLLTSVLDQNNDGKLDMNDAISAVTKKGGLGGLLGGLFGKK